MNFTIKNLTIINLVAVAFLFGLLSLVSFNAYAAPVYATCPSGQTMKGIKNNKVSCFKKESKRRNIPRCGTKRYRQDLVGINDKCIKGNKPGLKSKWTQPVCIAGGKYKAARGYDECRDPAKTTRRFYCKQGWTMKGNTTAFRGKGRAECVQPAKKQATPRCGTKRYRQDLVGINDKCIKASNPGATRNWTQPVCITGGKYKAVKGYDQCWSAGKDRHPWKKL